MASLSRIRVHPIKALDPEERERVRISAVGGLAGDRTYAIVDGDGEYVNGKRTAAVHRLRSSVDLDERTVSVDVEGSSEVGVSGSTVAPERFDLGRDRDEFADWLSSYFGLDVAVVAADDGGMTDNRVFGDGPPGVTVVSTATLQEVATWFPDLDVDDVRDRFRTNLEVDGVEAFWEDGLVADGPQRFRIGDVAFEAVKPVGRCVVPTRDPATGEDTERFRERFVERRAGTLPEVGEGRVFEHANVLTVLAVPAEEAHGDRIRVGDEVEPLG